MLFHSFLYKYQASILSASIENLLDRASIFAESPILKDRTLRVILTPFSPSLWVPPCLNLYCILFQYKKAFIFHFKRKIWPKAICFCFYAYDVFSSYFCFILSFWSTFSNPDACVRFFIRCWLPFLSTLLQRYLRWFFRSIATWFYWRSCLLVHRVCLSCSLKVG